MRIIKLLSQLKKRIFGFITNRKPVVPAIVLIFVIYPIISIVLCISADTISAYSTILILHFTIISYIIFRDFRGALQVNVIRRASVAIQESKPFLTRHILFSPNNELVSAYENYVTTSSRKKIMNRSNLQNSKKRFQDIFEDIKIGVAIIDASGKIDMVNAALEKKLGLCGKELKKKKFKDLFCMEECKSGGHYLDELTTGKCECVEIETQLTSDKRGKIWVRLIGSPLRNDKNRPEYIIVIDDITDYKETERIKDAFVDMVAHEFKNPLMALVSSLRLAKKPGQFPDVLKEFVAIASDSAESLWATLENLLEINQARTGRLKLASVRANIQQLISEVLSNTRQTLIHHIIMDIPDNLPQIVVDPAKIQLILRNLIDNAIKYSPKGGDIIVFARQQGEELVVGVKDEGIGISRSDQQNLFQPFERLGAINTAGSGLGLAVCKLLIKNHKGRIWVDSEPGKGSTFYFALPLEKVQSNR